MPTWVTASTSVENGVSIVRVLAVQPNGKEVPTDLYVLVPRLANVRVRTAFGDVRVIGVEGEIEVMNGLSAIAGGSVWVSTPHAVRSPIQVRTRSGNVKVDLGPNSTGDVDIRGEAGVGVRAKRYPATGVRSKERQWQGRLGEGTNPIVIRAMEGRAYLSVTD